MKQLLAILFLVCLGAESSLARHVADDSGTGSASASAAAPSKSTGSRWTELKSAAVSWWGSVKSKWNDRAPASEAAPKPVQPTAALPQTEAVSKVQNINQAEVAEKSKALPEYKTADKGTSPQDMKSIAKQVKEAPITAVVVPSRAAEASIPKNAAGVPVVKLAPTVKEIPALDIGQEAQIKRSDWTVAPLAMKKASFDKAKALDSPAQVNKAEVQALLQLPYQKAQEQQKLNLAVLTDERKITLEKVKAVSPVIGSEKEMKLAELVNIDEEELKFLRGMILYAQKDKCHVTAGIFSDLVNSSRQDIRIPSEFYLGTCLHKMGLFSESVDRLIRVMESSDPEYAPTAIETLVSDVPMDFEVKVAEALLALKDPKLVPEKQWPSVHYQIAKGMARKQKYELTLSHAEKIMAGHARYVQAQFLAGVAEYGMDKYKESLERYTRLKEFIEKNGGDKDVHALVTLNLARVSFQNKQYELAVKQFREIRKDHPLWIQALVEQGWAQLMLGDPAGAIGNMYSIHSPYFQIVWKPESYVVRTIGYLDICQFGDAYRTLSQLEHDYRPWLAKIQSYRGSHKAAEDYHALVVKYLKTNSKSDLDGMPHQVIREIARQRDYLNIQKSINARIDEMEQYSFIDSMIKRDREKTTNLLGKTKNRVQQLQGQLKLVGRDAEVTKNENKIKADLAYENGLVDFYTFQIDVFDEGRKGLAKLGEKAKANLEKHQKQLIAKAGEALKERLAEVEKHLNKVLDNNEFLRYEVFAGSGENLRFELAGGKTAEDQKRVPASAKPASKDLSWNFDGEFWEDEIGNYRSSLKNNCSGSREARK